jgi:hypothetical protein
MVELLVPNQVTRVRFPSPAPFYGFARMLKIVAGIAGSFTGLLGVIIFLLEMKIMSVEMAILMLVALLGMYLGFGVLIAVYRLIGKLE